MGERGKTKTPKTIDGGRHMRREGRVCKFWWQPWKIWLRSHLQSSKQGHTHSHLSPSFILKEGVFEIWFANPSRQCDHPLILQPPQPCTGPPNAKSGNAILETKKNRLLGGPLAPTVNHFAGVFPSSLSPVP